MNTNDNQPADDRPYYRAHSTPAPDGWLTTIRYPDGTHDLAIHRSRLRAMFGTARTIRAHANKVYGWWKHIRVEYTATGPGSTEVKFEVEGKRRKP